MARQIAHCEHGRMRYGCCARGRSTPERRKSCATRRRCTLARIDAIADERADGLLTGHQAQRATERIQKKLDHHSAAAGPGPAAATRGHPAGSDQVADAVEALPPDRLRAVISALMTITVRPVRKGGHTFDHRRIQVAWKDEQ